MMIDSALEFQTSDLSYVVRAFCTLPGQLRPTHYRFGEDEELRPIVDIEEYSESIVNSPLGPMLKGGQVEYVIDWSNDHVGGEQVKKVICYCSLKVGPSLTEMFLVHMAGAQPIFGYACSEQERDHRNRVIVKHNKITIQSWVGRDLRKHVPGFYWLTLLSSSVVEMHGIPLSEVKKIALDYKKLEGRQHLFRFYERPEEWVSTDEVSKLCTSLPSVFDVKKVRTQVGATRNYSELTAVLDDWS